MNRLMEGYIVLGHEIVFPSHQLSSSSVRRCDSLSRELKGREPSSYCVLFMGKGRLQGNCPYTISECMYSFFAGRYFSIDNIFIDKRSLDTVGDAVYSLEQVVKSGDIRNVHIITSDWHAPRALAIFKAVYPQKRYSIEVMSSSELHTFSTEERRLLEQKEEASLRSFLNTFPDADNIKKEEWEEALRSRHSLY